jgi:hypothetical protein
MKADGRTKWMSGWPFLPKIVCYDKPGTKWPFRYKVATRKGQWKVEAAFLDRSEGDHNM